MQLLIASRKFWKLWTVLWNWENLSHSAYSPNLSACDFFLFPRVKENLRGQRFEDYEAINAVYRTSLCRVAAAGLQAGILVSWTGGESVDLDGDYVE